MSADLNALTVFVPLPGGGEPWPVVRPWDKLTDKYFDCESALSVEFDAYAARRAAEPGWLDRVEGADLAVTRLMHSRITSRDVNTVLEDVTAVNAALARVPTDLDLADADLTGERLRVPLLDLFAAFRRPGVGVAKILKTLCLKRSRLLPMLDDHVRWGLYNATPPADRGDDPAAFAARSLAEVDLFRRVLLWDDNRPRLERLAVALSAEVERRTGLAGAVSPVRVLDNLLWFEWDGYQQIGRSPGWRWDVQARVVDKPG